VVDSKATIMNFRQFNALIGRKTPRPFQW